MAAKTGIHFTGINEMQGRISKLTEGTAVKAMNAIDAVLSQMVTWIQRNHESLGGWQNKSGVLEQSINYQRAIREGDKIYGIIYAGQDYGIYVEFTPGHWVISGGMNEFKPRVAKMLADYIKEQK